MSKKTFYEMIDFLTIFNVLDYLNNWLKFIYFIQRKRFIGYFNRN